MNTNTKQLQNRNNISSTQEGQIWDVLLNGEIIGSVHGQTRQQAEDTIRIWKMKGLTIAPTTFKG